MDSKDSRITALKVLVVGSGIAGPCFAYWLNRLLPSADITILERAPEPRLGGQAVDLRSASVSIVESMGLLQEVRNKTTTEVGIEFVYADGKTKAAFPVSGDETQQSSKSEVNALHTPSVLKSCSDIGVRNFAGRHGKNSI